MTEEMRAGGEDALNGSDEGFAHVADDRYRLTKAALNPLEKRNEILRALRWHLDVVQHHFGDPVEHTDEVRTLPFTGPIQMQQVPTVEVQKGCGPLLDLLME